MLVLRPLYISARQPQTKLSGLKWIDYLYFSFVHKEHLSLEYTSNYINWRKENKSLGFKIYGLGFVDQT